MSFPGRQGNEICSSVRSHQRHEEAWGDWFISSKGPECQAGEAGWEERSLGVNDLVCHVREFGRYPVGTEEQQEDLQQAVTS